MYYLTVHMQIEPQNVEEGPSPAAVNFLYI